jgi:hypothetical protein
MHPGRIRSSRRLRSGVRMADGLNRREADLADRDTCRSGVDAREADVDLTVDKFPLRRSPQPRYDLLECFGFRGGVLNHVKKSKPHRAAGCYKDAWQRREGV